MYGFISVVYGIAQFEI